MATRLPRSSKKRKAADQLLHYVSEHREMILYPEFRSKGWPIGSGPTESQCKLSVDRFKGRGRRWDRPNAIAVTALDSLRRSGQWNIYFQTLAHFHLNPANIFGHAALGQNGCGLTGPGVSCNVRFGGGVAMPDGDAFYPSAPPARTAAQSRVPPAQPSLGLSHREGKNAMKLFHLFAVSAVALAINGIASVLMADDAKPAAPAEGEISFFKQVAPIFRTKNCTGCHQPAKRGGEYVMTEFAGMLKGGESATAAIVPGDPAKSNLIAQITPKDGKAEMPKDAPPLSADEIALITKWIQQGAKDDTPMSTRPQYDAEHPPLYVAAPVLRCIELSPKGDLLAIGGYHEVLLHKPDGSGVVARLVGQSERIESASFSPDGKTLAVTGGSPGRFGEVQIWDLEKKALKLSLMVGYDTCYGAAWSPNGKMVSYGCPDNTTHAFDVETGKQVLFSGAHNDWVLDTAFSAGSDHLVSVSRDMSMKLVEVGTQRFVDNITSITPGALKGGLICLDRHPTKDEFLCGGSDGAPKVFKMIRTQVRVIGDNANLIREYAAMPGRVYGVRFSRDGNKIVAGSSNDGIGHVWVYNATDGAVLWKSEVPEGGIYTVDFTPDGATVLAAGFDGDVRLLNAGDGKLMKKFTPVEIKPAVAAK